MAAVRTPNPSLTSGTPAAAAAIPTDIDTTIAAVEKIFELFNQQMASFKAELAHDLANAPLLGPNAYHTLYDRFTAKYHSADSTKPGFEIEWLIKRAWFELSMDKDRVADAPTKTDSINSAFNDLSTACQQVRSATFDIGLKAVFLNEISSACSVLAEVDTDCESLLEVVRATYAELEGLLPKVEKAQEKPGLDDIPKLLLIAQFYIGWAAVLPAGSEETTSQRGIALLELAFQILPSISAGEVTPDTSTLTDRITYLYMKAPCYSQAQIAHRRQYLQLREDQYRKKAEAAIAAKSPVNLPVPSSGNSRIWSLFKIGMAFLALLAIGAVLNRHRVITWIKK